MIGWLGFQAHLFSFRNVQSLVQWQIVLYNNCGYTEMYRNRFQLTRLFLFPCLCFSYRRASPRSKFATLAGLLFHHSLPLSHTHTYTVKHFLDNEL